MHYEGAVTVREMTTDSVDIFDLPDSELSERWHRLIAGVIFSATSFRLPEDWFGAEFRVRSTDTTVKAYFSRVAQKFQNLTLVQLRQKILAVLKV